MNQEVRNTKETIYVDVHSPNLTDGMVRGKKCGTLHDFAITNEPMNQKTPYLPYSFDTVSAKSPRTTRNKQNVYSNLYSQAVTHPSTNSGHPSKY